MGLQNHHRISPSVPFPPHLNRSAVFDPELRPKGAHVEALPLSFDPEALDGEGGGEGGGDLRRIFFCNV